MKKLFLLSLFLLFSINGINAQQGVINGYDTEYTTKYNEVKLYNTYGDLIGKVKLSYDTYFECWNNLVYYNYQNYNGTMRLRVWVGDYLYYDKPIKLSTRGYTYLNDAFKHCSSSRNRIKIKISQY